MPQIDSMEDLGELVERSRGIFQRMLPKVAILAHQKRKEGAPDAETWASGADDMARFLRDTRQFEKYE